MVDNVISMMSGAVVGVIAFVVVKQIILGQTTTAWTGTEIAVVTIIPTGIGLAVLIGIFRSIK